MLVVSNLAKVGSPIVICATIGNVLNVPITLLENVWHPVVLPHLLPQEQEQEPVHVMLEHTEQTIRTLA